MKISVLTVCYNSAATIRRTVESFLDQDHADKELLVVDGASTDDTVEIVQGFKAPDIRIMSEPDRGIYDAMNKGLAHFSGDAFGFLNSDDVFAHRGVLSRVNAILLDSDIVCGDVEFIENHENPKPVRVWASKPFTPGAFQRGWAQPHPGLYCRRGVYDTVGDFDVAYLSAGDYDWMIRAYELNRFRSAVAGETFVRMTLGGVSTAGARAYLLNARETLRARRRWLRGLGNYYATFAIGLEKLRQLHAARNGSRP